jgi:RNA polymerase sigma-70 factor (ECF subfamily)
MSEQFQTSTTLLDGIRDPENARAWARFHERYEPIVRATVRRSGLEASLVDDVVQETMLSFARAYRRGDYSRDRGKLRTWLRAIASNRVIDALRQVQRQPRQIIDDTQDTPMMNQVAAEMTDVFDEEWQRAVLDAALAEIRQQFDEKTVLAFERYALQEEDAERVASELGLTVNAVYIAKSRVLTRLKTLREKIAAEF